MTDAPAPAARIFRYKVPVNGEWHTLSLSGPILHVAAREDYRVEVWALAGVTSPLDTEFRVFGTGQPLPNERMRHVGTTFAADGYLVWHLFERNYPSVTVLDGTN